MEWSAHLYEAIEKIVGVGPAFPLDLKHGKGVRDDQPPADVPPLGYGDEVALGSWQARCMDGRVAGLAGEQASMDEVFRKVADPKRPVSRDLYLFLRKSAPLSSVGILMANYQKRKYRGKNFAINSLASWAPISNIQKRKKYPPGNMSTARHTPRHTLYFATPRLAVLHLSIVCLALPLLAIHPASPHFAIRFTSPRHTLRRATLRHTPPYASPYTSPCHTIRLATPYASPRHTLRHTMHHHTPPHTSPYAPSRFAIRFTSPRHTLRHTTLHHTLCHAMPHHTSP